MKPSDASAPATQFGRAAMIRGRQHGQPADFADLVGDALAHLHDLPYLQRHVLASHLAGESRSRAVGKLLQQALLEGIEALKPGREVSPESHAWRSYQLLSLRYVEALDVPTVYSKLAISRREYYRDHSRAIQELALVLEERLGDGEAAVDRDDQGVLERRSKVSVLPSVREPVGSLPVSLTSFVGRENDLAEVKRLLFTKRFLTLTGSGGCGKTRLALQAASNLREEYPEGVWWVDLSTLTNPSLVPSSAAVALGLVEQTGYPILSTLIDYLRPRRCLLTIDNCEHLVDASARLVDALLRACPDLTVLATSREVLRIDGETVLRVPSLEVPDAERLPPLEDLGRYDSIRLFVERAVSAAQDFELTVANARAVTAICTRLDGLPLAIELAAARVRVLSPEEIDQRLDDRFRLLTSGSRAAEPRQQTLAATLDWSHDLLDEPERVLYRRLGVFVGGFSLEAAEAICSGDVLEPGQVLGLLARLVEKSLVLAERGAEETRYRLLETIREHASRMSIEAGEVEAVGNRHLEWYLELAERVAPELQGWDQMVWLARFLDELANFRAALDWSRARGNVEAELRWVAALAWFWIWQGYETEAGERLAEALARSEGLRSATRAWTLLWSGFVEGGHGNLSVAKERYEESLALAQELGDQRLVARSLLSLARVTAYLGTLEQARTLLDEALSAARQSGARQETALILAYLAYVLTSQGDEAGAWEPIKESLAIVREIGDKVHGSLIANEFGMAALRRGDRALARSAFEEGLANAREIGYRMGVERGVFGLGDLARAEGDYQAAEAYYREGATSAWKTRRRLQVAMGLGRLADLRVEQGRSRFAAVLYGAVDAWYAQAGMRLPFMPHPNHRRDLAAARVALGEEAFARAYAEGQAMTLDQAVEYALKGEVD